MSAVATKLQENGECFEANPFMTLKTAALMNSSRAVVNRTANRSSRAAQLSGNVSISDSLRFQRAHNTDEHEDEDEEDFVDSSASTRHGGEDEFEADDDYEEQIMCAFLLEQEQKKKRSSHGSNSKLGREEDGESMTLTTETASLSSRDSSSRYHNSTTSTGNNTRSNNKSLHSLDALIGDTGETMRMASTSKSSRNNMKRSSGSRRSSAAEDEDEDIVSEAISQERRRSSHSTAGASRSSVRSERTSHTIGSHARRRSDDNSKSGRGMHRSYTADDARRATIMDASHSMDSSSAGRRSSRGRRSVADNNSSTGQIVSDMTAPGPSTPSRRSRIRDRVHSNGKSPSGSVGDGDSASDAAVEGSVTPNNTTTKRLPDRPNSMELRRVVRDPSRRGRRATIGHDILMRNLQLQGLDDQQGGNESGNDDDDDSCVFAADFGDDFSGEGSSRMGGSERHYSTSSGNKKTDVWQNRRMAKPVANTQTPQRVSRENRQGSIQAATAALLANPADVQDEKAAVPGFGRSHTTSGIAQRRSRLRGPGP